MVLPLYLAMTDAEMQQCAPLPPFPARMGCTFSAHGQGLADLPEVLPQGGLLLVDDRIPFKGTDPAAVALALSAAADRLGAGSILLDFERPATPAALAVAEAVSRTLSCPVGMPPAYGDRQIGRAHV